MSKSGKGQVFEDEKKVIRELQKSSNESISNIAEKFAFSRQKVWRIIKRLEDNKTIWGYSTVINHEKLALKKYFLLLKRSAIPLSREKLRMIANGELKKEFAGVGVDVDSSFYVNGCYDFLLSATSEDVKLLKKFCETLKKVFEDCISDIQLLEVVFPLQKNGFINPNLEELIKDFSTQKKDYNYERVD